MKTEKLNLKNGDPCHVVSGTHKGKSGTVADLKTSKTGHVTITVVQQNGDRFKTLGRNVKVQKESPQTASGIAIKTSNITIMVDNMDKSVLFYESIGLHLKNRWGNHYAMLSAKDIVIGLHPKEKGEKFSPGNGVSIGFMIGKIEEAKALLKKNKIKIVSEADGKSGKYIHFTDPDGTLLYFTEPAWG